MGRRRSDGSQVGSFMRLASAMWAAARAASRPAPDAERGARAVPADARRSHFATPSTSARSPSTATICDAPAFRRAGASVRFSRPARRGDRGPGAEHDRTGCCAKRQRASTRGGRPDSQRTDTSTTCSFADDNPRRRSGADSASAPTASRSSEEDDLYVAHVVANAERVVDLFYALSEQLPPAVDVVDRRSAQRAIVEGRGGRAARRARGGRAAQDPARAIRRRRARRSTRATTSSR